MYAIYLRLGAGAIIDVCYVDAYGKVALAGGTYMQNIEAAVKVIWHTLRAAGKQLSFKLQQLDSFGMPKPLSLSAWPILQVTMEASV